MLAAPAAEPAAPPEVTAAVGRGVTVTSGDGRYSMNLRARIVPRLDVELPPPVDRGPIEPRTRATIATARLWLQGHLFTPDLRYVVQIAYAGRDYRDGATSPLFDAFVDWRAHRDASLKVGQYFVPFDRLRTVREYALQMVDRPRPVGEMTLDRDVGVTLYSDHLGADASPVAYRLGVFGGGGTNLTSTRPAGALFVGRLELRPLGDLDDDSEGDLERRARPGLAIGAGVAYNLNTNRQRSTTGAALVNGSVDYLHAAADLTFKWRGLAVQGEYLYREASEDELPGEAGSEWSRSGQGWVAQASYATPPGVEVVVRGSQMFAAEGTDPKLVDEIDARGNEVGAGINWYRAGHRFKVQTGWIALWGDDFAQATHTLTTQLDLTL